MPRWYRAYLLKKKVNLVLQQLQQMVDLHKLNQQLSVVRVEKGAAGGSYIFLGIDSDQIGEVPEQLAAVLANTPSFGDQVDEPFSLDQIRSMVSSELQLHRYLQLLPEVEVKRTAPLDPGAADDEAAPLSDQELAETSRHDRLLLILSALSSGSLTTLRTIWIELGGSTEHVRPLLRRLRRLGHLETTPDLQRWAIAPTVLVAREDEDGVAGYLLCGRRDQRLLHLLNGEEVAALQYQPQISGLGPSAVTVTVANPSLLRSALRQRGYTVHVAAGAALRLAQLLPADDGWYASLETLEGVRPHNYRISCYNGQKFVGQTAFSGESGLYNLQTTDGIRHELTLHYRAADQCWYRGDWYDLRFAAFADAGVRFSYTYDADGRQLRIPVAQRWPELYERALILASGQLPALRSGYLFYHHISAELLKTLAPKLRCEAME